MVVITYLVVKVAEREGQLFALWHSSDTEVKPCFVEVALDVGGGILLDPQVDAVLLVAAAGTGEVARAEIGADYDLRVADVIDGALRVLIHHWILLQMGWLRYALLFLGQQLGRRHTGGLAGRHAVFNLALAEVRVRVLLGS